MFAPLLNSLGDRNPQLLRELKSRLRGRGVATAIALSGLAQLLLLLFYRVMVSASPQRFCSVQTGAYWQRCLASGKVTWELIDWSLWWREIFVLMNWVIPVGLTGFGMYLLIGDIQQEEQRGTLNFIRLSPRRGTTVFLGKLLGIPILLYLGIALAVPLHLFAALGSKAPLAFVVSYYLLLVLDALLFFSVAIVVGLLVPRALKAQGQSLFSGGAALAIPLLSASMLVPFHLLSRGLTVWHGFAEFMFGADLGSEVTAYDDAWQWYGIRFGKNVMAAHGVQLLFLGVVIFWIWRILRRIYLRPSATTLSKRQSYGIVISGLVLFLGIFSPTSAVGSEMVAAGFVLLICLIWLISLCFAGTLLPSRQALLDWVQTRRVQRPSERSPLVLELLLGDRSPGIFAILVNLLILGGTSFVWLSHLPAYLIQDGGDDIIRLGLLLTLLMIAIYLAFVQLLLFLKTPKRVNWAMGTLGFVALFPMICAGIAALGQLYALAQILMLFSPLPWFGLIDQDLSPLLVGGAILVQVLMLAGLLWKLSRDLNRSQILTR